MKSLLLVVTAFGLGHACAAALTNGWPEVEDMRETFRFADVEKAGLDLTLKDKSSRPVYNLSCHSGSYNGDSTFNYSGLLTCRLVSLYSRESVSTLLTETPEQPSDWANRGRYLAAHLMQGCASYSDWGRTRTFRLRGMELTLAVRDERFIKSPDNQGSIQAYAIDVTVRGDRTATTTLAEPTKVPEPDWFYTSGPCPGAG